MRSASNTALAGTALGWPTRIRPATVCLLAFALSVCGQRGIVAQETAGGDGAHDFDQVDALLQTAVLQGKMPGAVLEIGHNGQVVYRKAYGSRSLEPTQEAMTADTIFDLASLTKVIATTTCVMRLEQLGQIQQLSLLYSPLGDKGPRRLATVLSKQSLAQQALADFLGLDQLCITQRG